MSKLFDNKTKWIDARISSLEKLPSDPCVTKVIEICHLMKRKFSHFPPPNDKSVNNSIYESFQQMENYYSTPSSKHADALMKVMEGKEYHRMIRWALTWNSNSNAFFKFEIIVVSEKLITGKENGF